MAIVVNSTTTSVQGSGTSYAVSIGDNVENDLVLVKIASTATSSFDTPPASWTLIGTTGTSQGARSAWFYRVAPSGGIASPVTFTVPNDINGAACLVVRYANTTPTIEWQRFDWGNSTNISTATSTSVTASSEAANAMITPPDNALLIYSIVSDGNPYLRSSLNELQQDAQVRHTSQLSYAIGHRQHGTGTLPEVTFRASLANEGGNMWVLSIADDGNGKIDRNWFSGGDEYDYRGDYGEIQFPFGTANAATTIDDLQASPPATPTLLGLNLSTTAASTAHTVSVLNSTNGGATRIRTTEAIAGSGGWAGVVQTLASNKDMSGKIFCMHCNYTINSFSATGAEGFALLFADGEGDWTAYRTVTELGVAADAERVCFIAVGYATELGNGVAGTMDWTNIDKIAYVVHRTNDTGIVDLVVKNIMLLGTAVLSGGYADRPATFQWSKTPSQSWSVYDLQRLQGSAQTMAHWPLQIGDGATPTYFVATASAFTTPEAFSSSTGVSTAQMDWNVPAGRAGITVYAADGDTIDFSASLLNNSVLQPFTFHASTSTDASTTYDFAGCVFIGWTPTWKTEVECNGAIFSSCDTVNFKGASPVNVTINDTTSTNAAAAWDVSGATADSCAIDGTGADYAIELGTAVTAITLTDCTITAGSTDKVHVLATTGTVTITISGTTSLAAGDVTSAGATVVISGPTINQKVTVSGITTGSRVQIYDTTSSTELFNGTATAGDTVVTGSTVVWTDPAAASADRAIRVRVSYVSGATAKNFIETSGLTCGQTAGTAEITYPVSPTDDTVYNANAITGSGVTGVTFTDAATDVVNINVVANAISWKTIYAAWVYYVFGATGIASDIDYIDAVDEANYILSNMIIKNTSSPTAPLEVTGGYGRDSVTGATIDLADTTGGTLIFAPDHVVSYAVGSGVTAQDKTDIIDGVWSRVLPL